MSEIDTKPIEPVRTALSLFGDKGDQKKYQPTRSKDDREKELEDLSKDLANYKVQLEAKNAAHMQALFKLEHSQKMTYELSALLKKSDSERNTYMNECVESTARIDELESEMKELADQHLENVRIREQLSHVLGELKATQRELLNKETDLVAARDSELNALTKAEQMETAFSIEKEQKEELLQQVKELNGAIHMSKLAATEAEKEKLAILSEKDQELELAMRAIAQAQKQVEDLRNQVEILQGLNDENAARSILVDSLQLQPKQASEALVSSDESASNAIKDSNQLDQAVDMEALEMELNQLRQEHNNAKEEVNGLNNIIESFTGELQKAKAEIKMLKERDIKVQVENALLISRLQEFRSTFSGVLEVSQSDHSNPEAEERNDKNKSKDHFTIPLKEYESLDREAEKTKKEAQASEVAFLKKELEVSTAKIGELRARAEQALSRAELAEKAKAALEDRIRRQREYSQRRRGALNALQEESTSDGTPKIYHPLEEKQNDIDVLWAI